jgi:hypothetical protein
MRRFRKKIGLPACDRRKDKKKQLSSGQTGQGQAELIWRNWYGGIGMAELIWRNCYGGIDMAELVLRNWYDGIGMAKFVWRNWYGREEGIEFNVDQGGS